MLEQSQKMYAAAKAAHETATMMAAELRAMMNKPGAIKSIAEFAEIAYAANRTYKFLKETQRTILQLEEFAEKTACSLFLAVNGPAIEQGMNVDRSIKTDYVCATPEMKLLATLPRQDSSPEQFAEMMDDLGFPRHVWEGREHALAKIHWPGVMDRLEELSREGKPLPRGIDPEKMYPKYTLTMVGRKEPDA